MEGSHDSAAPYYVAAEAVVVSLLAAVEDRDDGQNSMVAGGMENLAGAVMAHSLSAGCIGDR